jgi:hypothetical protein
MTLQELQKQALHLPISDRWRLVQTLLESLQRESYSGLQKGKLSRLPGIVEIPSEDIEAEIIDIEPISTLSNERVLALTELEMAADQDARLSELLDRQQAGILAENEFPELQILMQTYQEGLLRKAIALSEAVKRGLIEPLSQ